MPSAICGFWSRNEHICSLKALDPTPANEHKESKRQLIATRDEGLLSFFAWIKKTNYVRFVHETENDAFRLWDLR